MIVTCDKCSLKYKVDPEKITGDQARLTCKGCGNVIIVKKPAADEYTTVPEPSPTFETSENETAQSLYDRMPPKLKRR
jgi:predicted Zn finger-like uncharacterized protein